MDYRNQRGQVLIESVWLVALIAALLMAFQIMIDHQKNETSKYRLAKYNKDIRHDKKETSDFNAKK